MTLKNKLGITDSVELARIEEKTSKRKAIELFENGTLDALIPGIFESLAFISLMKSMILQEKGVK